MKTRIKLAGWWVVTALFLGVVDMSQATGFNWISPASGNWNVAGNWDNGVPTGANGDTVYVQSNVTVTVNDSRLCRRLYLLNINSVLYVTTNGVLDNAANVWEDLYLRSTAEIQIDGGTLAASTISVSDTAGSNAKLTISGTANLPSSTFGGRHTAQLFIGSADGTATGTVVQTGGTNYVGYTHPSGKAAPYLSINNPSSSYSLYGGTLNLFLAAYQDDYVVPIAGVFNYGNASGTGQLNELALDPWNAWNPSYYVTLTNNQHVGITVQTNGLFRGHGSVVPNLVQTGKSDAPHIYKPLVNYGKIIADGYGTDRELAFTNFSSAKGGVQGGTNTTDKGWYAVNNGKLTLGALTVNATTTNVTWGDTVTQTNLTMVNSFLASFAGVSGAGALTGSLLATNRTDIPAWNTLSNYGTVAGIWSNSVSGFTFSSASLTFRYDSANLASSLCKPDRMKVYNYQGSAWVNVTSANADTNSRLAYAQSTKVNFLAVVLTPPPKGTVISIR